MLFIWLVAAISKNQVSKHRKSVRKSTFGVNIYKYKWIFF
jgi:hypothetical protein